jgi:hypothetical protein
MRGRDQHSFMYVRVTFPLASRLPTEMYAVGLDRSRCQCQSNKQGWDSCNACKRTWFGVHQPCVLLSGRHPWQLPCTRHCRRRQVISARIRCQITGGYRPQAAQAASSFEAARRGRPSGSASAEGATLRANAATLRANTALSTMASSLGRARPLCGQPHHGNQHPAQVSIYSIIMAIQRSRSNHARMPCAAGRTWFKCSSKGTQSPLCSSLIAVIGTFLAHSTSKPSQYSLQQLPLPPVLHAVARKDASALSSGADGSLKRRT